MNRKAIQLVSTKTVLIFLLIFVIIYSIFNTSRLNELSTSGISTFQEQACEAEGYKNQNIKNCEINSNSCNELEIKKWNEYLKYLNGKICGENTFMEKEIGIEKEKSCTCIQKAIFFAQELEEPSNEKINKDFEIGNTQDNTNVNIGTCEIEEGSFDASKIEGTPYWVTTKGETGKDDLLTNIGQVARDTSGTSSYGNFGLNSKGGALSFWGEFAQELGLEGIPGSIEADNSWKKIAKEKPNELALAEVKWYNKFIIEPTAKKLELDGFKEKFYTDPRIIAYLSDVTIQEGASLRNSLLLEVELSIFDSPNSYLEALSEYQSSDEYLKKRFRTYLAEHPDRIEGLRNRILKVRYPLSKQVTILKIEGDSKIICKK